MTVKDLAAEVQNLKHLMEEKDNLVNNLEKKFENLQLWAHGCFTDICYKINESAKLNIDNGKVIETKFNDVETKVDNLLKRNSVRLTLSLNTNAENVNRNLRTEVC